MRSNKTLRYFRTFVRRSPNLTGRERTVLIKRLRSKTLITIGRLLNVSEGRVRQVEISAIQKIRSKIKQLSLFKMN